MRGTSTLRLTAATLVALAGCHNSPVRDPEHPHVAANVVIDTRLEDTVPREVSSLAEGAFLFENLGSHHRMITTRSVEAQTYFDQGLRLLYGFNHDEAARSFAKAAKLDPTCAMCFWGVALALGPNYNVPLLPDRAAAAYAGVSAARHAAPGANATERELIEALALRHPGPEYLDPEAMKPHAEAYAAAMRDVAHRHPDDDDVQVLFAESMMDLNPWKLWSLDGVPADGTEEIVQTLETVLARSANHPGANHYYIHAVEASRDPGRALEEADRLVGMMPDAGHLEHMPAHIFQRVGRYADASAANRRGIASDQRYLARTTPPGYYAMYVGHNHGFLAYSASMEGRKAESVDAAEHSASALPHQLVCNMPGFDFFLAAPYLVGVRFGLWDQLLADPAPPERYPVLTALWHHAHGMAAAAKHRFPEAEADLAALKTAETSLPENLVAGWNSARKVVSLATKILEGSIAERKGDRRTAIRLYGEAVAIEDGLAYSEPADWFYPTRHFLGAVLLDARKPADAERVYREDLERHPHNGWALFGLWKALEAQHKRAEATRTHDAFEAAFANADVTLTRTAF